VFLIVVAGVDDVCHRVAHPVGWFGCAEFIEHKHIDIQNRREHTEFRGMREGIVGILDLFQ
jgi:hypothetical protein